MNDHAFRIAGALAASLALSCGGAAPSTTSSDDAPAAGGEAPSIAAPAEPIAEVPFPAPRIREATPAGRTYVFRFEDDGEEHFERWVFERVDERGFTFRSTPVDRDGQPVGEPEVSEGTWDELEAHAHFPAAQTEISNATLTIPLGAFRCRLYTVTREEEGRAVVSRYWFATDLPGAPIRMVREVDGEQVAAMMLVGHEPPIDVR